LATDGGAACLSHKTVADTFFLAQDVSKGIVRTTSDFAPGIFEEFKAFLPSRLELKNGVTLIEWLKKLNLAGTA
jgi:hypothetical protein